jgi:glyoxylate carboligase
VKSCQTADETLHQYIEVVHEYEAKGRADCKKTWKSKEFPAIGLFKPLLKQTNYQFIKIYTNINGNEKINNIKLRQKTFFSLIGFDKAMWVCFPRHSYAFATAILVSSLVM